MHLLTRSQFLTLLILWFATFLPTYPGLLRTWLNHSDNSHGLLVPFITLYFIWQRRGKLRAAAKAQSNLGYLILGLSLALYLLSYAGGIAVVSRSMIVFSFMGLILFTFGKELFRVLAFPLCFLFFMVPVPDSVLGLVALPLQLMATKLSTIALHALSIPAYREGNMLYFSQTQLEVAEACSGIRSIISYTMLGVIFGHLLDTGWGRRILIVASALPLALFANIVRVSGTGILAHFCGRAAAMGFLHEFSGLAVFAFGFFLLMGEFLLLKRDR